MTTTFYSRACWPLIRHIPAETAHRLAIAALRYGLVPKATGQADVALASQLFGLTFENPVGLAAGFDKDAEALDALLAQGFGFVEAGTVTPRAQAGNPKPRLFRLEEDRAIINRMGFNNAGLEAFVQNLASARRRRGVVGANLGKNKDSADALADYVQGLHAVYPHADYITINISSPNTQGLRDLQKSEALDVLLGGLASARAALLQSSGRRVPLLLKVAPDLDMAAKESIAAQVLSHGIDGLIVSNTTTARPPSLRGRARAEQGGLSGAPLMALSTQALVDFYRLTQGRLPLVGVGGIASADDAYAKIRAGASLVQLYTALAYQGFGLVAHICNGLSQRLKRDGFTHLSQAVGSAHRQP
jgi:dihydroorotate dehydrogenase